MQINRLIRIASKRGLLRARIEGRVLTSKNFFSTPIFLLGILFFERMPGDESDHEENQCNSADGENGITEHPRPFEDLHYRGMKKLAASGIPISEFYGSPGLH